MSSEADSPNKGRPRVLIIGGGFGGLFAAKFLRRADVDITLVDRTNHHLFQPLLYQLATGVLSEGEIAPPLRDVLRKHRNVTVELANVTRIDLEKKTVHAVRPIGAIDIGFDFLIVASGGTASYFGNDQFSRYAPSMKTVDDALEIRGRILGAFEMAETEQDEEARRAWLNFAVIGGGPTGVEMAGQIAELSQRAMKKNFRNINPADIKVRIFDGGEEVLATFGNRLSDKAANELERLGIELKLQCRVVDVDRQGLTFRGPDGDEKWACHTKVWAAGVEASPLGKLLADAAGAETDRAGRVQVEADCSLPGQPDVFVVGDLMALDGLPGVAEVAMQSGIHAATAIKKRSRGETESKPFKYRDLGSMAYVSRFRAVVDFKGIQVAGLLGWLMWAFVHLTFMTGFKNRFLALFGWLGAFVGSSRSERTITIRQVSARVLAEGESVEPGVESMLPSPDSDQT